MQPFADVVQPVWDLIKRSTSVPSFLGFKSGNTAKKRYNWEPVDMSTQGPSLTGEEPRRRLHDVLVGFEVHCRGGDFDACFQMAADLVTAVRQVLGGASYTVGTFTWTDPSGESSTAGWSLVVPLTLMVPLYESDLDQDRYALVTVTEVGFDVHSAADGDGTLIAPDS